ncbi:MAG: hypothetical protein AAFR68_19555 [Pseudomonadota bacterium]
MIWHVGPLVLAAFVTAGTIAAACSDGADSRVDIYPTASELPENLLRLYVYFPRAMALSEGMQSVVLRDENGVPVNGAFLPTHQELWSPDRQRLTLLLDPGRVKSGLSAHELMGRALVPDRSYTLVVSGDALDAAGCGLGADTSYTFIVTVADDQTPDPAAWSMITPRLGSRDTLSVDLGSTHDHLSLAYRLRVVDAAARIVPGALALGPAETSWHFTPRDPWQAITYELIIDERLEDVAGNRPGVLFDRPVTATPKAWKRALPFTPGTQNN